MILKKLNSNEDTKAKEKKLVEKVLVFYRVKKQHNITFSHILLFFSLRLSLWLCVHLAGFSKLHLRFRTNFFFFFSIEHVQTVNEKSASHIFPIKIVGENKGQENKNNFYNQNKTKRKRKRKRERKRWRANKKKRHQLFAKFDQKVFAPIRAINTV